MLLAHIEAFETDPHAQISMFKVQDSVQLVVLFVGIKCSIGFV